MQLKSIIGVTGAIIHQCSFCKKTFKRQESFSNHYCNARRKHDELGTVLGQIGFHLYERWVLIRHSRKVNYEDFKASRFFNAFIKFAKYYKCINGFSDLDEFLKVMISKDFLPSSWLTDKVMAYYVISIEKNDPMIKIENTCNYILKICEAYDCDSSEFFNYLEFYVLLDFIKMHKLSPWVLLNSKNFFKWLGLLSDEQQYIIDSFIDSYQWKAYFNKSPAAVKFAKACCKELDI